MGGFLGRVDDVWRLLKPLALFLVAVGGYLLTALTAFQIVDYFVGEANAKSNFAYYFVFIVISIGVLLLSMRVIFNSKKEKYANIVSDTHQIQHEIRNLTTFLRRIKIGNGNINEVEIIAETIRRDLQKILDRVSSVFSILTSTNCRASLKVLSEKQGVMYVVVYARDSKTQSRVKELDQLRESENCDPLKKNSGFYTMFQKKYKIWHYFNNNLPMDKELRSTSKDAYDGSFASDVYTPSWWGRMTASHWVLPYRSTVSAAIRLGDADGDDVLPDVIGFLAVDSESRNVFNRRRDVDLVFSVADALYHPLNEILSIERAAAAAGQGSPPGPTGA
ncbi:MAG: hypothetical protein KDJ86_07715 [Bauldia sp.]|uniref:hypothetical protein n=1 Tax=Bauldia sp. TaxID=2575872 RepID=UPI001DF7D760|nr:hypothetical protein [Bauldia sp.]MCB1495655.1 hypothetical protein [Bauldia sp.]